MTIKQKYNEIDQSKLPKSIQKVLKGIEKKTNSFEDTKANRMFESKLDNIRKGLKKKYPEALDKSKPKDDKKAKSAGKTLRQIIDSDPVLKGIRGTDIIRDKDRKAKASGKRISKSGNIYYEYRENRTDRYAPEFPKNKPFLEKGGQIDEITEAIFMGTANKGKVSTSFGDKTMVGLKNMISNFAYTPIEIANAIFGVNKSDNRVNTMWGAKSKDGLTAMIQNARKNLIPEEFGEGGMVYIDFLNAKKGFKKDRKHFNSWDDAVNWAKKTFEKFTPDMINYMEKGGQTNEWVWTDLEVSPKDISEDTTEALNEFLGSLGLASEMRNDLININIRHKLKEPELANKVRNWLKDNFVHYEYGLPFEKGGQVRSFDDLGLAEQDEIDDRLGDNISYWFDMVGVDMPEELSGDEYEEAMDEARDEMARQGYYKEENYNDGGRTKTETAHWIGNGSVIKYPDEILTATIVGVKPSSAPNDFTVEALYDNGQKITGNISSFEIVSNPSFEDGGELDEDAYIDYLNEIGEGYDYESDEWIIGGEQRLDYFPSSYGIALQKYDPIGFQVGLSDWAKNYASGGHLEGFTNQTGLKNALMHTPDFNKALRVEEQNWMRKPEVKIFRGNRFGTFHITDGKRAMIITRSPHKQLKRLGRASQAHKELYEADKYEDGGSLPADNARVIINDFPYFLKRIDSTHLRMANSQDGVDIVIPMHVGQLRGEPYYDDVRSWLKMAKDINGNEYTSTYLAKGGGVYKSRYQDRIDKLIEEAPEHNKANLRAINNATFSELQKWVVIDEKAFNKTYRGKLDHLKYDLIKTWAKAKHPDQFLEEGGSLEDFPYSVWVWSPTTGEGRSFVTAKFRSQWDAEEYAKMKAREFTMKFYSNRGTYITDESGERTKEFPQEMFKDERIKSMSYEDGGELRHNYMMLGRLQSDNDYFLGYGRGHTGQLWAGNVEDQIAEMKRLWNSFPEDQKPEWLTMEQIEEYETKMLNYDPETHHPFSMEKGGNVQGRYVARHINDYVFDENGEEISYRGWGIFDTKNNMFTNLSTDKEPKPYIPAGGFETAKEVAEMQNRGEVAEGAVYTVPHKRHKFDSRLERGGTIADAPNLIKSSTHKTS